MAGFVGIDIAGQGCKIAFFLNSNLRWDETGETWITSATKSYTSHIHTLLDDVRFHDVHLNLFSLLLGESTALFRSNDYKNEGTAIGKTTSLVSQRNTHGLPSVRLYLEGRDIVVSRSHLLALVFRRIYNTVCDFAAMRNSTKTIKNLHAIIVVPDYFDTSQQKVVLKAVSAAGFERIGLFRDSTAARKTYQRAYIPNGVASSVKETVIFLNVGHSVSTISVVEFYLLGTVVLAQATDHTLGTRDIDKSIATYFSKELLAKCGVDISLDSGVRPYLVQESSKAWRRLIFTTETSFRMPLTRPNLTVQLSITFETLQAVISPFTDGTHSLIQIALKKASLANAAINTVVILGEIAPIFNHRILEKFPSAISRSLDEFWKAKGALKSWKYLYRQVDGDNSELFIDDIMVNPNKNYTNWMKEANPEDSTNLVSEITFTLSPKNAVTLTTSKSAPGNKSTGKAGALRPPNTKSQALGSVADVAQIDAYIEEALAAAEQSPESDPERPNRCHFLSVLYLQKYASVRDVRVASSALVWAIQALGVVDYRSQDVKPEFLGNVALCLKYQYDHTKDLQTLNTSILYQSYIIKAFPTDNTKLSFGQALYLVNYGACLQTRGDHLGDSSDLVQAGKYLQQAISVLINSKDAGYQQHLIDALINLGNTLQTLYKSTGNLDDLYNTLHCHKVALSHLQNKNPERSAALSRMGFALLLHYEHFGSVKEVHEAIEFFKEALEYVPDDHPSKPLYLSGYATALKALYRVSKELETVNLAIQICLKIRALVKHDNPADLDKLAGLYAERFGSTEDLGDLNEAIRLHRTALQLLANEDQLTLRFTLLNNLGITLRTRFERIRDKADALECISTLKSALEYVEDGSARAKTIHSLARVHFDIFDFERDDKQRLRCIELCKQVTSSLAPLTVRFNAAQLWTRAAIASTNGQVALEATTTMVDLLSQLAWPGLSLSSQLNVLRYANQAACNAASIALHFKDPIRALEWLEQGRTVSWNQLLHMRSPLLELKVQVPELADKIIELSRQLDVGDSQPRRSLSKTPEALQSTSFNRNPVALERDKLLKKARAIPGFEKLLLGKDYSQFHIGTYDGPVVVINVSYYRCDALIILNGDKPYHLPLPTFSLQQAEYLKTRMLEVLQHSTRLQRSAKTGGLDDGDTFRYGRPKRAHITGESIDADFRYILKELYVHVVEPIANCLGWGLAFAEDLPRIWWCLTGPLTFLPLHAAGIYATDNDHETARISIMDYAVSSYIPNLSALHNVMHKKSARQSFNILSVIQPNTPGQQPLPATLMEMDIISRTCKELGLSEQHDVLQDDHATCEAVIEGMITHSWIHLACHGQQDAHEPTKSGLHLHDGTLYLEDIVKLSLPNADFAFLSACQTASGDISQPDEAVHLAAGMLMAGYNSVVASMWSIEDSDAAIVAEDVYGFLFGNGRTPDSRQAARALHQAVINLRTKHTGRHGGGKFLSWLPYIHLGL